MTNPIIEKLSNGAPLTSADRKKIEDLLSDMRDVPANADIVVEGENPEYVHAIVSGFACRYKNLSGGDRQIMAFLVPGDLCDLHVPILSHLDHSIGTLTPCRVAYISHAQILDLFDGYPSITRALWWSSLVDESVLREWIANIGQRSAEQRLAHLFCELHARIRAVGLVNGGSIELPITQEELADALGLSTVHINRVLQQLRGRGLLTYSSGRLTVEDYEKLAEIGDFSPSYLYLNERSRADEQFA